MKKDSCRHYRKWYNSSCTILPVYERGMEESLNKTAAQVLQPFRFYNNRKAMERNREKWGVKDED
ncbi:hypothetical protein [Blautia marasmi]|uniref:hypothetical protein n=1 Tax=Blautia marasmi TaxID=1917868 RepID=UPI00210EE146|nr:hypothetical protein [Blautia marasmi]